MGKYPKNLKTVHDLQIVYSFTKMFTELKMIMRFKKCSLNKKMFVK